MKPHVLRSGASALLFGCLLIISPFTPLCFGQSLIEARPRPDVRRALGARAERKPFTERREGGHAPLRGKAASARPSSRASTKDSEVIISQTLERRRRPARITLRKSEAMVSSQQETAATYPRILSGTPLSWILHTSQLSLASSNGTNEQYVDANADLAADERTTFDRSGGSFDIAVGRSGARYEVFTATLDNRSVGIISIGRDANNDYVNDYAQSAQPTFNLERDFGLPSAVSVVSGTSRAGREFVVVSSSGYYKKGDPESEPSAGVVLLVRDTSTNGFDATRSRSLVKVSSNELNNANALALLPNNDLLIADFDSNELRVVRDTDDDGLPDWLDPVPFYSYRYSTDAPVDITANSRGVVFSHSAGNDTVMLALYDDDLDGYAEHEEVVVEGLSIDNNLVFHGLTTDREGTVYVIMDASGAADTIEEGGNLGEPLVYSFPDPALNGYLRDGAIFSATDSPGTQALSGLAFGFDASLPAVAHLAMTNSASLRGDATAAGLATIQGTGLTLGESGRSEAAAASRGVQVTLEGHAVPVLSFNDSRINIYVPEAAGTGVGTVVVYVHGNVLAADDARVVKDNPGVFTTAQNGAGEAVALLVSGMQYTRSPFSAKVDGQASVIALFGTGWRNSLPASVTIGGQKAVVEYAGPSGGFNGLDQLNVRIPTGVTGTVPVIVTTASGATSRADVSISIK